MIEKVFKFGSHEHLIGVVSTPENSFTEGGRPAVLLLNSGLLHRIGPYRLNVDLGRILASDGYLNMRFDLSGIGDSQFTPEKSYYAASVICDIQNAMDFMQKHYKSERFVLIGNCSGASNAEMSALADKRITGLVLMDGFAIRTFGFYFRVFIKYLKNPFRFFRMLGKIINSQITKIFMKSEKEPQKTSMFSNSQPKRAQLASEMRLLVERGVAILCIYSGGLPSWYSYPTQFLDMFKDVDFQGMLQLEHFKNADHLYTAYSERRKLIECTRQWLNHNFI
jgi:hypothetical protein